MLHNDVMIFKYILVGLTVLYSFFDIYSIDKERSPITREEVMLDLLINAVIVYGLFNWI